jgi:hypothetical protein
MAGKLTRCSGLGDLVDMMEGADVETQFFFARK